MPQTDFFAMPEDEERLIRFAFDMGMEAVPDIRYDDHTIVVISKWEAFCKFRHQTQLFFLFSNDTLQSQFQTVEIDGTGEYVIAQKYGGPYIFFLNYSPIKKDDKFEIPGGMISYYPTYYDSLTGNPEKPSGEFKRLFKSLNDEIKRNAKLIQEKCFDGGMRNYWVTENTEESIRNGAELGIEDSTM